MVPESPILLTAHPYASWQAIIQLTLQQIKYYLTKIPLGSSCFTVSLTCLVMFLSLLLLWNNCMIFYSSFSSPLPECSPLLISRVSLLFCLSVFGISSGQKPLFFLSFLTAQAVAILLCEAVLFTCLSKGSLPIWDSIWHPVLSSDVKNSNLFLKKQHQKYSKKPQHTFFNLATRFPSLPGGKHTADKGMDSSLLAMQN